MGRHRAVRALERLAVTCRSVIDGSDIGDRAREIAAERWSAITQCTCRRPDDSSVIDDQTCPAHREAEAESTAETPTDIARRWFRELP